MIEAVLSMNGWVCVPNMGASISGLGLKLPPEPLPFLTTAQGCHSPNWNPLQAIAGHDSPALNSGGWAGGTAHQGPEYACEVVLSGGADAATNILEAPLKTWLGALL